MHLCDILLLCKGSFTLYYLPEGGLAAASTEVRLRSWAVMPALATEMVCCSIAWRHVPHNEMTAAYNYRQQGTFVKQSNPF